MCFFVDFIKKCFVQGGRKQKHIGWATFSNDNVTVHIVLVGNPAPLTSIDFPLERCVLLLLYTKNKGGPPGVLLRF